MEIVLSIELQHHQKKLNLLIESSLVNKEISRTGEYKWP